MITKFSEIKNGDHVFTRNSDEYIKIDDVLCSCGEIGYLKCSDYNESMLMHSDDNDSYEEFDIVKVARPIYMSVVTLCYENCPEDFQIIFDRPESPEHEDIKATIERLRKELDDLYNRLDN